MRKLSPHGLHHEPHVKRRRGAVMTTSNPIGVTYHTNGRDKRRGAHNARADKEGEGRGGKKGFGMKNWKSLPPLETVLGIRYEGGREGGRKQKLQLHDNGRM